MASKQPTHCDEQIIINDLLSFMFCKCTDLPKEKLLSCVSDFYCEESISEAHKALFSIIPFKKSNCSGRGKKNLDELVSIYECFLHTSSDDLPFIVCKNLNNVPSIRSARNDFKLENFHSKFSDSPIDTIEIDCTPTGKSDNKEIFLENGNYTSDEEADSNWQSPVCKLGLCLGLKEISIYKREQFQMRCQISEMVAIISELKEGLKDFTNNFEGPPLSIPKSIDILEDIETCGAQTRDRRRSATKPYRPRRAINIESNDSLLGNQLSAVHDSDLSENFDSVEGNSSGVALLQKFIDEDDEENVELFEDIDERENLSSIEFGSDDYDLNLDVSIKENCELGNSIFRNLSTFKTESFSDNENETDSYELNLDIFVKDNEMQNEMKNEMIRHPKIKKNKRATNIFKHPKVIVPSKCDKKVILIQEEDKGNEPTIISNCNFSLETDNSMDISSCGDSIKQFECFTGVSDDNIMPSNILSTEGNALYSKNQMGLVHLQYTFRDGKLDDVSEYQNHKINELKPLYSFDCILCSRNFRSSMEFNSHFVSCLKENEESENLEDKFCPKCGIFYAYPTTLKKHMIYHSQKRKFSCSGCSLRFIKVETLDVHIKKKHSPLNTFFCQFCPQSFNSKRYMMAHVRNHTGEKPYKCDVCGLKTETSNHLKEHLEVHSSLKQMICKICSFTCFGFSKLTKHMQYAHTTPLVCPRADCGKSYIHYFQYKRHRSSHMQEAKFKCSLCLYTTSIKSSEVKHIRTHANTNYQCPECFVNLASKHNVSRHLKSYCRKNFPLMEN